MSETGVALHEPVVVSDGGPWAVHDHACCVCRERKSVLNLDTGRFSPCWECQRDGWQLVLRTSFWRWLRRRY